MSDADAHLTPEEKKTLMALDADVRLYSAAEIDRIAEEMRSRTVGGLKQKFDGRIEAPPLNYFRAIVFQQAFSRLCGADPQTLKGGNARVGAHAAKNVEEIIASWNAPPARGAR